VGSSLCRLNQLIPVNGTETNRFREPFRMDQRVSIN